MSLKSRIFYILVIAVIGMQAFPQQQRQRQQRQRDSESPDFNFDGKLGEKTHRSLDQVQYQDAGVVSRGRSTFTDSYGNPVAYDTLDDVDAQKPSNNKDNPFQYVIPGYASGILQPHEIPSRSSTGDEQEGRKIEDDRIHFVDPLHTNAFQVFDKLPAKPLLSLAPPGSSDADSQSPIDIPKPNINLPETPEAPIDDPIDHVPQHPPQDVFLSSAPSTTLELPIHHDASTNPIAQNLVPPEIPSSTGVEIPRPNLDAPETPIDNDNTSPLNKGLLPPNSDFNNFDSNANGGGSSSFGSGNDGPVIITDDQIKFAPKPVNGLLPPKEPTPNDIDFQSSPATSSFSNSVPQFTGTLTNDQTTPKQYTPFPTQAPFQIPVQVIQPSQPNFIQPPKTTSAKVDKFQGGFNFGGAPGILSSENPSDRVVPTQAALLPLAPSTTDKFLNFGGAPGVLTSDNGASNPIPAASTTSQTFTSTIADESKTEQVKAANKYTGRFGGPPGILSPNV